MPVQPDIQIAPSETPTVYHDGDGVPLPPDDIDDDVSVPDIRVSAAEAEAEALPDESDTDVVADAPADDVAEINRLLRLDEGLPEPEAPAAAAKDAPPAWAAPLFAEVKELRAANAALMARLTTPAPAAAPARRTDAAPTTAGDYKPPTEQQVVTSAHRSAMGALGVSAVPTEDDPLYGAYARIYHQSVAAQNREADRAMIRAESVRERQAYEAERAEQQNVDAAQRYAASFAKQSDPEGFADALAQRFIDEADRREANEHGISLTPQDMAKIADSMRIQAKQQRVEQRARFLASLTPEARAIEAAALLKKHQSRPHPARPAAAGRGGPGDTARQVTERGKSDAPLIAGSAAEKAERTRLIREIDAGRRRRTFN